MWSDPYVSHWYENKQKNKKTNKQTNKQTSKQANERTNERTNEQTNKQTNKQTDKQTNKQTNKQTERKTQQGCKKLAAKQAIKSRTILTILIDPDECCSQPPSLGMIHDFKTMQPIEQNIPYSIIHIQDFLQTPYLIFHIISPI